MHVLVADSSCARFFVAESRHGSLREIETLVAPQSRLHARDLVSSAPGRSFDRAGGARHAIEPHTPAKRVVSDAFARDVAARIDALRRSGTVHAFVVAAAPQFLGLLRQHLTPASAALVEREIDKDLTHLDESAILSHLAR